VSVHSFRACRVASETGEMLAALQAQSIKLNDQLTTTRRTLATIDPVDTPTGRRWLWLVTALILVMGVLVVVAGYAHR